jgi:hypothetical protein
MIFLSKMKHSILIVGWSDEPTLSHLIDAFGQGYSEVSILDLNCLRTSREVSVDDGDDLTIKIDDDVFVFSQYQAFFLRAWWKELDCPWRSLALQELLSHVFAFVEYCPAMVVNRPSAGFSNSAKLRQLISLGNHGFKVPNSFISMNPDGAQDAVSPDGSWIIKGTAQHRTKVKVLDEQAFFNMEALAEWPALFQERVIGSDVRVHVIGEICIGIEMATRAVDYRYPGNEPVRYSGIAVPLAIKVRCLHYCQTEGLLFCGFDFKISEATNDWVVLEANPMPAFNFFDKRLGGTISHELIRLLTERPENPFGGLKGPRAEALIPVADRPSVWR